MDNKLKQFYSQRSTRNLHMSDEASKRVKENIFSRLSEVVVESPAPVSVWTKISHALFKTYVLVPLVVLLFITGTTYASADALPGDALYGVKRTVEQALVVMSPRAEGKLELQIQFAQERFDELEKLRALHIPEQALENNQSDHSDNEGQENTGHQNQPEERAQQEANQAIERLNQARQKWEQRGNQEQIQRIDRKVNEFRERLNSRAETPGAVRGLEDKVKDNDLLKLRPN